MSKGENIYKRKDGRWEARFHKGRNADGKIVYGFCYGKTYREAKSKVDEIKSRIRFGNYFSGINENYNFSMLCDSWFDSKKYSLKQSSSVKYEGILNKYIKPIIGNIKISCLGTESFNRFTEILIKEKKLSNKTVKDILIVLNAILKFVSQHYNGKFSCFYIAYPKVIRNSPKVLTNEEQIILINYLLKHLDNLMFGIYLTMNTGLRIGEICALKWEDIDFCKKILHVHLTMQRLSITGSDGVSSSKVIFDSPKSRASNRIIPLTDELIKKGEILFKGNPDCYILTGSKQYMEPRLLQYRFSRILKECNIKGVHFHTLRHTFATRAVESGFEIKSLSEILGHSSVNITLENYVHSSMEQKRINMDRLFSYNLNSQYCSQ